MRLAALALFALLSLAGCEKSAPYAYCVVVSAPEAQGRGLRETFAAYAQNADLTVTRSDPVDSYQSADKQTEIYVSTLGDQTQFAVRVLGASPDAELVRKTEDFIAANAAPHWPVRPCATPYEETAPSP